MYILQIYFHILGEKLRELLYKYDMEMDLVNLNIERELLQDSFRYTIDEFHQKTWCNDRSLKRRPLVVGRPNHSFFLSPVGISNALNTLCVTASIYSKR